jgi:hypothetical protein
MHLVIRIEMRYVGHDFIKVAVDSNEDLQQKNHFILDLEFPCVVSRPN